MKRKLFFLATMLIFMELVIFSVGQLNANSSPFPTPTPSLYQADGRWYYHNRLGTEEGIVHVNSNYVDARGKVWSKV